MFDLKFKDFQGKFQTHWLGPYEIIRIFDNGAIKIRTVDEEKVTFLVNSHRLKLYHKPLSREEFVKKFQENSDVKLMKKNFSSSSTWLNFLNSKA